MKRTLFLSALLGLLFILPSCQRQDEVGEDLGLTSPSGARLANGYDDLGDMIKGFYATESGKEIAATVKGVEWETGNGIEFATVTYANEKGTEFDFALARQLDGSVGEVPLDPPATTSCDDVSCSTDICGLAKRQFHGWSIWVCVCVLDTATFGPGCSVKSVEIEGH